VVDERDEVASAAQTAEIVGTVAYGASESYPSRLPVDFGPLGHYLTYSNLNVRLAGVHRRGRIPVDELVADVPTLQEKIVLEEDESTLRRNLDFFIEEFRGRNSIRFVSGQNAGPDVFEGERPPRRLWAEYTYLDNSPTIEANFGEAVELTRDQLAELPENVDYLSAVTGLLYAFTNGPTVRNLRIGTQILLGLPYAEEDGTIEELRKDLLSDNGRILIRDTDNPEIVRSYTYPKVLELETNPATGERYKEGDAVVRFSPLVEGASVIDYVKDPDWWVGIVNQGVFFEVQKFHTFLVRVDSRAFNLSSLLFVRNFILKIKPTYTYPKFVVQLLVSDEDGDEISVNDTVEFGGTLTLEDGLCRGRAGASLTFDQPRPAGGGIRNRFDNDDDPNTSAVYPTADPVYWGYDKEYSCPSDVVSVVDSLTVVGPYTPEYDAVFVFDEGVNETFNADQSSGGSPIDTVGFALTLDDPVADEDGTISYIRFIGLGSPAVENESFELLVTNTTTAQFQVIPFDCLDNQELLEALSITVTAGDVMEVRIRVPSGSTVFNWTRVICRMGVEFAWSFDMGVIDPNYGAGPDPLASGTYTTVRQISP